MGLLAMGFNRRKMEDQRRQAVEKEAAARRATYVQVLEEAERLIAAWNERQAKRMPMLFSLTIGAAIMIVGQHLMRTKVLHSGQLIVASMLLMGLLNPAIAGPPYRTDDPEPTDYGHYEIYAFTNGIVAEDGTNGAGGIDFNYGGAPNLQLTATLPVGYTFSDDGPLTSELSNIELAAKYRFLTEANFGLDVAVFPRVFLPSASSNIGESHASFLLPIWVEKDWDKWSAFGGGGCEINRGGNSQDFCLAGLVITNQITPKLQAGLEIFHQTSDTQGGSATTSLGTGVRYDLNDHYHLLGYVGRGIENVQANDRLDWYAAILFTF